jgi:hypothetical protein
MTVGKGGARLRGRRIAGWSSGGDDLLVTSENALFSKKQIPKFTGKTRTEKEKRKKQRNPTAPRGHLHPLVGHSTLIVWRDQCVRMRPHCTRCSMRERGCHREKTERKREQSGSIPAPRRASCRLQGSRAPRPLRP